MISSDMLTKEPGAEHRRRGSVWERVSARLLSLARNEIKAEDGCAV